MDFTEHFFDLALLLFLSLLRSRLADPEKELFLYTLTVFLKIFDIISILSGFFVQNILLLLHP